MTSWININRSIFTRVMLSCWMLMFVGCSEPQKTNLGQSPRPVSAMLVITNAGMDGRTFPGRAKAVNEVNLGFNVAGTLIQLPIQVGQKVNKDQIIAQLDPREFESKLKLSQAESKRDEENYKRAQELIRGGHISQSDFDIVKAKWEVSQANLEIAQKSLSDTVIKAPFTGVIASLPVQNYQTVSVNQVITRLLDSSSIEMVIQIPENLITLVPYAKDIQVKFDPFPKRDFPATIKEIGNEATSDTRTYPITLTIPQPSDMPILPGMAGAASGRVDYPDKAVQNELRIPRSALVSNGTDNKSYVWIVDEKTSQVHRREVSIRNLTSTGVSVTAGLHSGEWLVIAGANSLSENEKVTILNQEGSR